MWLLLLLQGGIAVGEHLSEAEADAVPWLQTFLEQKQDDAVLHEGPEHLKRAPDIDTIKLICRLCIGTVSRVEGRTLTT